MEASLVSLCIEFCGKYFLPSIICLHVEHFYACACGVLKLWSMATAIKLIILFRSVGPIFGSENPSNNKLMWSGLNGDIILL